MFKKRFIYSAFSSALFFAILYLVLDFNLLVSLFLAVICYVGGVFWFKEKDIRKYDPNLIMHYCYLISKINNYTNYIKSTNINKIIKNIVTASDKIINMLEQKPNKVTQVYDGFDFYLPTTVNILEQYVNLSKKDKYSAIEEKFINETELCLNNIDIEISKLLENMNYTRMLNISSRINMFVKDNEIVENDMVKEK